MHHLEKGEHTLVCAWHDTFRERRFTGREAVAPDIFTAVESRFDRVVVDEIGAGALKRRY
jgi:hypothetical protein